ncbi:MAG: thioredoxin-disulfide reductase [Spirochaetes bacterium RBG_13_68_11]|nr:MAG: thioredoxin-disulfide reductase [Spirochaetes bacterium RBG_13_68_11]
MTAQRDLIVVGGGAAGLAAAQYGARAGLDVLVLEQLASGGQALVIDSLENYPGLSEPVSGFDFSQRMEQQAVRFGVEIMNAAVSAIRRDGEIFTVETDRGPLAALAVVLATGAKHRHLGVTGEQELAGRGVSYCATCDGPFFKGRRMLVVGGGDAACDEAMYLANLASSVLLVHRRGQLRAQKALADRTIANPKIEVRFHTEVLRILGDKKVSAARLVDNTTGREYDEATDSVFIFVGSIPQTAAVPEARLDEAGYVVTDQRMETSIPGLFAAGDVRSTPFRQLVVAAAEGAVAAHAAGQRIEALKGRAYA